MAKPITGQYEFLHRSGVGLDYFTSRIDRLTLQPDGRFILIIQERSRIANAAQSLMSGQQIATNAPEVRREGTYSAQGNAISFRFDDAAIEDGQMAWNGEGMQFGPNFFNKVSDSTLLPSTQRMKKDMDDIAKGMKIAGTIGSMAMKAAKTIQDTMQTTQKPGPGQQYAAPSAPSAQTNQPPATAQPQYPASSSPPTPPKPQAQSTTTPPQQREQEALFCDQCGARARPGKRFCNNCGAQLP
jgi:zinc-ribbon domain